ncbi:MAG: hypothetical protein WCC17_14170 [Candidatus Nitrosopolaris sp.]
MHNRSSIEDESRSREQEISKVAEDALRHYLGLPKEKIKKQK